jgi:hypothetical protein
MLHRTLCAGAIFCALLASGCQTAPATHSAFEYTYAGKELPPAWFRYHHQLEVSNGHEFRGFEKVRRHWFQ